MRNAFPSSRPAPVDVKDRGAAQCLLAQHAAYKAARVGTKNIPWPREALVDLGRLFVAAYAVLPPAHFLRSQYGMANWNTVMRVFGSLEAYHAALQEAA